MLWRILMEKATTGEFGYIVACPDDKTPVWEHCVLHHLHGGSN